MKSKKQLTELKKAIREEIQNILKEADEVKLTQLELTTLKSFEDDLKTIKEFAADVFNEVLTAQKKFTKVYGVPSPAFDAYMRIITSMVPITVTLGSVQHLLGAIKQGKFGKEIKLSSEPPSSPAPPPPPPNPPKISLPPIVSKPQGATKSPPQPPAPKLGPPPPPPK
jgi:hypothetical protein